MRLTKIICTLGPATADEDGIRGLAEGGMNIARLNFSHGDQEGHRKVVRTIKKLNEKEGLGIALLLDTKGTEIRTGDVQTPIAVKEGQQVVFTHAGKPDPKRPTIMVNYAEFWKDVKDADCILVDNGELIFDAVEVFKDKVVAKARGDGAVGSRRHVNLPGADVSLPSITDKDWADIALACEENMDFIALSFVRNAKEIEEVKKFVKKKKSDIRLIAKIENAIAVRNIAEIVEASDGVMVARGDLGAEVPLETVPAIQDEIVGRCRAAGKPVIVATHMLESMIKNPLPTRAEVTDIAHAAVIGTDCTMLSGETAAGKHPYEALEVMSRVLVETEKRKRVPHTAAPDRHAHARAAVTLCQALDAEAVIVFSHDDGAAAAASALRAPYPIYAFTDSHDALRKMQILYGVKPFALPRFGDADAMVKDACKALVAAKKLRKGDRVVLLVPDAEDGSSHTVQSRVI